MSAVKSEDEYGRKYDKFITNTLLKMGTGLTVGAVFSLLIFRRRLWPIHFGLGTGFGFSACDFQYDLNNRKS